MLTHVCFDGDKLFAFDDKTAVVVYEETGIQGAVRGRVLIEMVENADDEIELTADEQSLTLTDGSSSMSLPMLPPETFLFQMPDLDSTKVAIEGSLDEMEDFLACLELAAGTSNEESLRPELVGVTIHADEGGPLLLYSTDNISCTRVSMADLSQTGKGVAIIPKSSCQMLAKTFRDLTPGLGRCSIYFLDGAVLATYTMTDEADVWVVCKTIPVKPADYETIIETYMEEGEFGDLPEGFEKALSRASAMFKDDYARAVQIQPTEAGFDLYCKGDYGELTVSLESEVWPDEALVTLNPDLLRRMLSQSQALMFCSSAVALVAETDSYHLTYLVAYKRA